MLHIHDSVWWTCGQCGNGVCRICLHEHAHGIVPRESDMREFPALSTVGGMLALLVIIVVIVGILLILLGQGLNIPMWVVLLLIGGAAAARLL